MYITLSVEETKKKQMQKPSINVSSQVYVAALDYTSR